jgi:pimeloyl-ACP methyl ester carboxylesterase
MLQGDFLAGGALPDHYAAELAGLIPDAIPLKFPGVGHNIHGTHPDAVLRAVIPFLASLAD